MVLFYAILGELKIVDYAPKRDSGNGAAKAWFQQPNVELFCNLLARSPARP